MFRFGTMIGGLANRRAVGLFSGASRFAIKRPASRSSWFEYQTRIVDGLAARFIRSSRLTGDPPDERLHPSGPVHSRLAGARIAERAHPYIMTRFPRQEKKASARRAISLNQ